MNNVAKLQADYQKSSWVQLTHNMFDLVMAQSNEVEKAVIGMGEYRFKPAYKQIEISCNKWFMMSPEQRKSHMRKVFAMECTPVESEVTLNNFDVNRRILSIAPERCGIATISSEVLEITWKKAEKLLNTTGSLCKAPGMSDAMCVSSDSGSRPHIVSKTKKGSFACDDACIAWKSKRFCSHILAVAEDSKRLGEFLSSYRRSKVTGSYTAASTHNQPKSVGKKRGCPRRKGSAQFKKPEIESYIDPFPVQDQSTSALPPLANPISQSTQPVSISQSGHSSLITSGINFVSADQICQFNPQVSPSTSIIGSPALSRPGPRVVVSLPFEVKFLTPLIKICAGCRKGYERASDGKSCLPAPRNLCLVHKEQHLYYNVVNCKQQLSSLNNVHYHANSNCPRARFPDFNPRCVCIPEDVKLKLKPEHWVFLLQTFGIA